MIDLNKDIIYTKKLSKFGNKINKISKEFSNVNFEEENIDKLKDRYENYLKAINDYKKCKTSLSKVVPPSKVLIDHVKIVDLKQLLYLLPRLY